MTPLAAAARLAQARNPRPNGRSKGPHHVLGITDVEHGLADLLETACDLKQQGRDGPLPPLLAGKAFAVLFEKNSTRTRISFDVGIRLLGGVATILDSPGSQLARGESIEDTARALSGYVDGIVYRASSHAALEEMARHARVPVVNALTDREHPCQVLADLMTLQEHFGSLAGRTLAYVGDGNNMCHSYLLAGPLVGMDVQVATPVGYGPDPEIVAQATAAARRAGTRIQVSHKPGIAVHGADAVATDTWISMGSEKEQEARLAAFAGFTIDDALMDRAGRNAVFLHCLPGHWGQEATHAVAHGPRSLVFDQAENRMWSQMALLVKLAGAPRSS